MKKSCILAVPMQEEVCRDLAGKVCPPEPGLFHWRADQLRHLPTGALKMYHLALHSNWTIALRLRLDN